MSSEFTYQCPHCQKNITVAENVLGNVIDCPNCENPFKIDVPSAKQISRKTMDEDHEPEVPHPEHKETKITKLHPAMFRSRPIRFLLYWAMLIVGGIGAFMGFAFQKSSGNDWFPLEGTPQSVLGLLLALTGAFFLVRWYLTVLSTELTVTDRRTILRRGIFSRQTSEVQHDDVRNLQVAQNIYERIAHIGNIAVSSSGQDDLEIVVKGIPNPEAVAQEIRDLQD